ncbi:MAG: cytochrome c3 family protein [Bryobacterales bacterium]|nr:cytochrome c3 family protein [Bryobacterales bacterium]
MIALLFWWAAIASGQEVGKQCLPCHSEHVEDVRAHKHAAKQVGCEVCHGPSQTHRDAVGATAPDRVAAPDEVPALCGSCHTEAREEYVESKHGKLVLARAKTRAANCGTCHGVHAVRDAAAMKRQCDRCHAALPTSCKQGSPAAGKLICSTCHAPHTLARRQ